MATEHRGQELPQESEQSHKDEDRKVEQEIKRPDGDESTAQELPDWMVRILEMLGVNAQKLSWWLSLLLAFLFLIWKILESLGAILSLLKLWH